ncbi:sulfur carrier protein ThiS [Psychromicrobium lacuslunae]|uniref:Thiamine biosynthesis protein ThiS n=1 Tax=Psychromicrobium lacuslunae TaxID=1618207 RepID=A0A0D4BZM1_9MICC|nr:sulfur carrier protein ThiS [Psychromicrobium lacuslunae]AJT41541.1 thiamine biosynthesis protein ThiS [Psychromicrobium lacuslunae]
MKIMVNRRAQELEAGATVLELVALHTGRSLFESGQPSDGGRLGIAVARNGELVPRRCWAAMELNESDELDLVTAVQGG